MTAPVSLRLVLESSLHVRHVEQEVRSLLQRSAAQSIKLSRLLQLLLLLFLLS